MYRQSSGDIFVCLFSSLFPFSRKDEGAKVHPDAQFSIIGLGEVGCEPLTHMGSKTNGESHIWVKRSPPRSRLGFGCRFLQRTWIATPSRSWA